MDLRWGNRKSSSQVISHQALSGTADSCVVIHYQTMSPNFIQV
jgi:hypothetical protein